jgi:hypothetical protein
MRFINLSEIISSQSKRFLSKRIFYVLKMVSGDVVVRKGFNYKKLFLWVFGIVLLLVIIYGIFLLGAIFGTSTIGSNITYVNPVLGVLANVQASLENQLNEMQTIENLSEEVIEEVIIQAELEFDQDYINYVLHAMSAWKLHNPPLSSNKPKIRVIVDEEIYNSEVDDGVISTFVGDIEDPDIAIITTKREVIQAMLVEDMTEFMKLSVAEGRTTIEMLAGQLELASKGYLQMYEDVTGESLI